jgi:3-methyladenine DNA glycosylase AlkD
MKNTIYKNSKEVEQALRKASTGQGDIAFAQHYMGTAIPMIGRLAVPVQRAIFKKGFSFSNLPLDEQLEVWDAIWNSSEVFEVMSQCLMFVQKNIAKLDRKKLWNITREWVKKIDNWGHSDMLSGIYSWLMEQEEDLIYPQLLKWNTSKNPWERRQSLVSIFEYSSKRKKVLPVNKVLPLVEKLLDDKDKFVQKGVGWCLRECGNVYPKETGKFLLDHHGALSSIAFSAATEKIKAADKEKLKDLRKAGRESA